MMAAVLQHICLTTWFSWILLRVKSSKKQLLLVLWCSFCCVQEEFLLKSAWNPFSSELWLQVDFCLVFRLQFQRQKGFSFFHVCCFARVRPTYSSREWTFLPRHLITHFRVQAAAGFIRSVLKCLDFEMYQFENRHPALAFDKQAF